MEESAGDAGRTAAAAGAVPEPQPPAPALIASSSSLRERARVSRSSRSSRSNSSSNKHDRRSHSRERQRPSTGSTTIANTPGSQHEHGLGLDHDHDHNSFELHDLQHIPTYHGRDSSPSTISSGSIRIVTRRSTRLSQVSTRSREPTGRFRHIIKFWRRHVVLSVPQSQKRDHYGECGSVRKASKKSTNNPELLVWFIYGRPAIYFKTHGRFAHMHQALFFKMAVASCGLSEKDCHLDATVQPATILALHIVLTLNKERPAQTRPGAIQTLHLHFLKSLPVPKQTKHYPNPVSQMYKPRLTTPLFPSSFSPRTNLPRAHAHLARLLPPRRHNRTTLQPAALALP